MAIPGTRRSSFPATRWSLVAALGEDPRDTEGQSSRQRLIELCLLYWYPVFVYLRRSGHAAEAAHLLATGFFRMLLKQGRHRASRGQDERFRTFLLGELQRFLVEDDRDRTGDRDDALAGIDEVPVPPLAQLEARRRLQDDSVTGSAEQALHRGIALELIARTMRRLEDEARQAGRLSMYQALQPYLTCEPEPGDYDVLARPQGVSSLYLTLALKRLRQRFRELVDDELAQTVSNADALDAERKLLHDTLQGRDE